MADEKYWIDKAQSLEAQNKTLRDQYAPAIERVKAFKANFGVKEKADGSIVVDYEKFARNLGPEGWLELRRIGDEIHSVTGAAGEKPRIRVKASA